MVTKDLMQIIVKQYPLSLWGTHGISHWARVLENGRRLAETIEVRLEVVELFAVFHDAKRKNERIDCAHGRRGGDFAGTLRGKLFDLSDSDFDLLYTACANHTNGTTISDITVMVCWDSDRLDLGRVHMTPKPNRLCTEFAKDPRIIDWAEERSRKKQIPGLIFSEWGIEVEE